jgi:hypothetical protein
MTTLDPSIAVREIGEAVPGSLVQLGTARGFCARHSGTDTRSAIVYYPDRNGFRYNLPQAPVLDFGVALIIVPNLESLDQDVLPSEGTTQLFLVNDSPKIVFANAGNPQGPQQLDLKTGAIEALRRQGAVPAFREWKVGIKTIDGDFLLLLDVRPRHREEGGSTEPDVV